MKAPAARAEHAQPILLSFPAPRSPASLGFYGFAPERSPVLSLVISAALGLCRFWEVSLRPQAPLHCMPETGTLMHPQAP